MRLLLDTHALIWWSLDDSRITRPVYEAIRASENEVLVSAVSAVEIAIKYRNGKLPEGEMLAHSFERYAEEQGFVELPLTALHGRIAGTMSAPHKDPFDRMLVAQALMEGLILVSNDTALDQFALKRLW